MEQTDAISTSVLRGKKGHNQDVSKFLNLKKACQSAASCTELGKASFHVHDFRSGLFPPFQTIQGDKALEKLSLKNYTSKLKIVQFLKAKPNHTKKTSKKIPRQQLSKYQIDF